MADTAPRAATLTLADHRLVYALMAACVSAYDPGAARREMRQAELRAALNCSTAGAGGRNPHVRRLQLAADRVLNDGAGGPAAASFARAAACDVLAYFAEYRLGCVLSHLTATERA